jgi:hypothetical protein
MAPAFAPSGRNIGAASARYGKMPRRPPSITG